MYTQTAKCICIKKLYFKTVNKFTSIYFRVLTIFIIFYYLNALRFYFLIITSHSNNFTYKTTKKQYNILKLNILDLSRWERVGWGIYPHRYNSFVNMSYNFSNIIQCIFIVINIKCSYNVKVICNINKMVFENYSRVLIIYYSFLISYKKIFILFNTFFYEFIPTLAQTKKKLYLFTII